MSAPAELGPGCRLTNRGVFRRAAAATRRPRCWRICAGCRSCCGCSPGQASPRPPLGDAACAGCSAPQRCPRTRCRRRLHRPPLAPRRPAARCHFQEGRPEGLRQALRTLKAAGPFKCPRTRCRRRLHRLSCSWSICSQVSALKRQLWASTQSGCPRGRPPLAPR